MEIIVETVGEYTGMLYGNCSYSIYKNGREVFHTGFRNINTREELIENLKEFPKFIKILEGKNDTRPRTKS